MFTRYMILSLGWIAFTQAGDLSSINNIPTHFAPPFYRNFEMATDKSGLEFRGNWRELVNAADTVDTKLLTLDQLPKQASVKKTPWSGDYWPYFRGSVAYRYNQRAMRSVLGDWPDFYRVYQNDPPSNYVEQQLVTVLSPAEKYDLLVGDKRFGLSQFAWNLGQQFYEQNFYVPNWLGLCDGQAAASIFYAEPKKTIDVPSVKSGQMIRFYPDDIKALAALLWTQGQYGVGFAGAKCESPRRSDGNFASANEQCQDINPGLWHLVVLNQVGRGAGNLIVDTDPWQEVWNYPVLGYRYQYVNIASDTVVEELSQGLLERAFVLALPEQAQVPRDARTTHIIGVRMEVDYRELIEVFNYFQAGDRKALHHNKQRDGKTTKTYRYDLELDAQGAIIGGHWYGPDHPDFVWNFKAPGVRSIAWDQLPAWNGTFPVPAEFTRAASGFTSRGGTLYPGASTKGQPLEPVVQALVDLSAQ